MLSFVDNVVINVIVTAFLFQVYLGFKVKKLSL